MPLPETIAVRYTEEEADNFSIRPVKRQTFQVRELVDMILRVAGKDEPRVRQILRSGTIVYHFYRYWWQGFDADSAALAALLAEFPSDDPQRPFDASACNAILLDPTAAGRRAIEVSREEASRKPLFAAKSFWDCLLGFAQGAARAAAASAESSATQPSLTYAGYSFDRTADQYQLTLGSEQRLALAGDAATLAARPLRTKLEVAGEIMRVTYICPRSK